MIMLPKLFLSQENVFVVSRTLFKDHRSSIHFTPEGRTSSRRLKEYNH
jgi:hypothetical protein